MGQCRISVPGTIPPSHRPSHPQYDVPRTTRCAYYQVRRTWRTLRSTVCVHYYIMCGDQTTGRWLFGHVWVRWTLCSPHLCVVCQLSVPRCSIAVGRLSTLTVLRTLYRLLPRNTSTHQGQGNQARGIGTHEHHQTYCSATPNSAQDYKRPYCTLECTPYTQTLPAPIPSERTVESNNTRYRRLASPRCRRQRPGAFHSTL